MKKSNSSIITKKRILLPLPVVLILFAGFTGTCVADGSSSSRFDSVRNVIFRQAYSELPRFKVSAQLFGPKGDRQDNRLLTAARRTLTNHDDLIEFPGQQKLFQPNGICFTGQWMMDHALAYTGLFKAGVRAPVIARGSVMLSGTTVDDKRAFGMAVKIFPGHDLKTENLLLMESMGGSYLKHVLNASLDNHPRLGSLPRLSDLGVAIRIRSDLTRADKEQHGEDANIRFRSINHIAAVTETGDRVPLPISPHWIRLTAADHMPRINADDFRDELDTKRYPNQQIHYRVIGARFHQGGKRGANWQDIGTLVLSESITSAACDTQLHFHHPAGH